MEKILLKNSTPIYFLIGLVFSACSTTNKITQVDLSNWQTESENVTNLSILLEDDGIKGNPVLLDENTLIFESKKNDNN